MADHDPLCYWPDDDHGPDMCGGNISKVRADERSRCDCTATTNALDIERAAILDDLRAKVEERLVEAERIRDPQDVWLAMAYREVLRMIKEARDG